MGGNEEKVVAEIKGELRSALRGPDDEAGQPAGARQRAAGSAGPTRGQPGRGTPSRLRASSGSEARPAAAEGRDEGMGGEARQGGRSKGRSALSFLNR